MQRNKHVSQEITENVIQGTVENVLMYVGYVATDLRIEIRTVELIIFCSGGKIIRKTGEIERYGKK